MSFTITLAPDVEQRVKQQAAQQHVTVDEYVNEALRLATQSDTVQGSGGQEDKPKTGREIIESLEKSGALWRTDMVEGTTEYADRLRNRVQRRYHG